MPELFQQIVAQFTDWQEFLSRNPLPVQIGVANCENEDTPGNIILPKHIGYLTILEVQQ